MQVSEISSTKRAPSATACHAAPTGSEFFPTTDPNQVRVTLDAPDGTHRWDEDAPQLRLLQRVRDEAHRFAVQYHQTLRDDVSTVLDDVPGVGPETRKRLLRRFGSVEALADLRVILTLMAVVQMIGAGEESGKLGEVLDEVSSFYTRQLKETIKLVTSMIEPLMIVFLAVVVGFIVIALFMPIIEVIRSGLG